MHTQNEMTNVCTDMSLNFSRASSWKMKTINLKCEPDRFILTARSVRDIFAVVGDANSDKDEDDGVGGDTETVIEWGSSKATK